MMMWHIRSSSLNHSDVTVCRRPLDGGCFCPGLEWRPAIAPWARQILAEKGAHDPDAVVAACAEAHRVLAKAQQGSGHIRIWSLNN